MDASRREFVLGFAESALAPGVITAVTSRMSLPWWGRRLYIAGDHHDATIHQIRIGDRDQLAVHLAPPHAAPTPLALDGAAVAEEITLFVSRPDGGDFKAAIIGVFEDEPLIEEAVKAIQEGDG